MKQILLNQGKIVVLDDEDFGRLSHYNWSYRSERNQGPGYATRKLKEGKQKYRTVYLHRDIMAPVPPGYEVIFRNGDRLDCRRCNLLIVTIKEARQHHLRARSDSASGIKGTTFNWHLDTWTVNIYRGGMAVWSQTYDDLATSQMAYKEALLSENPVLHSAPKLAERVLMPVRKASRKRRGKRQDQLLDRMNA